MARPERKLHGKFVNGAARPCCNTRRSTVRTGISSDWRQGQEALDAVHAAP